MGKEAVTYIQFVTKFLNEEKKKAGFESKKAMGQAAKAWKDVKAGKHDKFEAATSGSPKPGHKRAPSKTRKGRLDYVTHKGSKFYNRDGHRQDENESGVAGKPYELGLDIDALDLCPMCKEQVKAAMSRSSGRAKKGGCGCSGGSTARSIALAGGKKSRRRGGKSRRAGKTRRGRK